MKRLSLALAVASLVGCSTSATAPLVADKTLQLTAGTAISQATLAGAAVVALAIYVVYDPLAPNWQIEESRLNGDTYRLSLAMKRYNTGGAGESLQILKRRASQLQAEHGFGSYVILEYTEGIDSKTLGARRVAEGTIRLVQRQEADSFNLNGVN